MPGAREAGFGPRPGFALSGKPPLLLQATALPLNQGENLISSAIVRLFNLISQSRDDAKAAVQGRSRDGQGTESSPEEMSFCNDKVITFCYTRL
jgi:hypothetical protein